ncbi:hypothetical protein FQR65_LT09065 [Abscondita terminalis]|nr:hypothetical protein FQR65_LT09065 [Abscondita terminalis]
MYAQIIIIVILISLCANHSIAKINTDLILQFFQYKHCSHGVTFTCLNKREKIVLAKRFYHVNIRVSIHDVNFKIPLIEIMRKDQSHLAIVVDGDCNDATYLLKMSAKLEYFYDTYHWLVFGSHYNVTKKFKDAELAVNADVSFATTYGASENWTILDIYNPSYKNGGQLVIKEIGNYSDSEGFHLLTTHNKYFDRKNMSGVLFKSAVVVKKFHKLTIPLNQYLSNDNDRSHNTFNRFHNNVVENCEDFFNFEVNKTVVNSWGYQQLNREVDGMLKLLKEKLIDFGSAPLLFKPYRLKLIDYGYGTWVLDSAFIFRHPKNTASSYELYLRPLQTNVWICTSFALILIIMILRFIVTNEKNTLDSNEESNVADSSWSFLVIYSIGELCQQGFSYIPSLASGRIVIMTVLIFFFLIYQFYSASIVSFLLMEPPRSINTLSDLLKSHLKAGCEDSLYDKDYIATTTDPVAIELYNKKMKGDNDNPSFLPARKGLDKVKDGGFAFHTQTATAYPIIESQFPEKAICELAEVKMYATQTLYMTLPKKSPLKEMFNYCMFHQMEVGVLNRLRKHWDAHKPQCVDHTPYLEIEVGLNESYWALILLSIGMLCADNKFFYETYHWLAFTNDYNKTTTFENVGLAINVDLTVAVPNPKNDHSNWTLLDVYNPSQKRGGELKVNQVGYYNKEEGYNTVLIWNKYYARRNMTGTTFTASMVIPENISMSLEDYLESEDERNNNTFSRFNSVTVHHCQDFYNFAMNKSIIHSWGYVQEDGDVDGLVRQLKYSTVDFGIAALLYKAFRLVVVDYGYGSWIMKYLISVRYNKPLYISITDRRFFSPSKKHVQLLRIIFTSIRRDSLDFNYSCTSIDGFGIKIYRRQRNYILGESSDSAAVGESNWSFLIIYNIGELCQQGFSYIPVLASGRIAVLTVLIFFFLIYQFYSASIVSFLLLPPKKTMTMLSDLLKSSLQVGAENILYDMDYFKTTTDPVAIALYNSKIRQPFNKTNFLPPQEGLDLVKVGGYAFHTQTSTGYPIIRREFEERAICELAEVHLYKPLYAHMVLAKKSPLREMFMFCNVHQMEVGIIDRLRKYWDAYPPQCVDYTPYLDIKIGLHESYWALILLGFGIFTSIALLVLEKLWKNLAIDILKSKIRRNN